MKTNYSDAFVEQAIVKLLSRGERTIESVAQELNINHHTARNWVKKVWWSSYFGQFDRFFSCRLMLESNG